MTRQLLAYTDGTNFSIGNTIFDATGAIVSPLAAGGTVVAGAGEAHIGEVGGNSAVFSQALTITASSYSALNNVGGLLTLTNAMRGSPATRYTGVLQNLTVADHANQKAPLDILIFKSIPAATFTDHSAFPTLSQADTALVIARVSIASSDYVTIGGSAFADVTFGKTIQGTAATLYAAVQIASSVSPTYAATTDLTINFGFLRD